MPNNKRKTLVLESSSLEDGSRWFEAVNEEMCRVNTEALRHRSRVPEVSTSVVDATVVAVVICSYQPVNIVVIV